MRNHIEAENKNTTKRTYAGELLCAMSTRELAGNPTPAALESTRAVANVIRNAQHFAVTMPWDDLMQFREAGAVQVSEGHLPYDRMTISFFTGNTKLICIVDKGTPIAMFGKDGEAVHELTGCRLTFALCNSRGDWMLSEYEALATAEPCTWVVQSYDGSSEVPE